jgi:hypothetical protein
MIAWLFRHGGPRTGEVLTRLGRHGWTLELPYPGAVAQTEPWASARFADVEQARAAARPFQGRVSDLMRWTPADRPADKAELLRDVWGFRAMGWTTLDSHASAKVPDSRNPARAWFLSERRRRHGGGTVRRRGSSGWFGNCPLTSGCPEVSQAGLDGDIEAG